MSFTTPTTQNWTSAAFRNEIVAALWERWTAAGNVSSVPMFVGVTDSAQSAAKINAIQNEIESLCTSYVNHTAGAGGDFSGLAAMPVWQTTDNAADNFLFYAMASGQMGWRRQVVKGTWATPGHAQAGDLWGTWIFEDLQRALLLLKWVPFTATNLDGQRIDGSGGSDVDWDTAKAACVSDYNAFTPISDAEPITAFTRGSYNTYGGTDIRAYATRIWGSLGNAALPTLATVCAFDLYGYAIKPVGLPGAIISFDGNGEGWLENLWFKFGSDTQAAIGAAAMAVGSAALPSWVSAPDPDSDDEAGYLLSDARVVLHAVDSFTWK